MARKPNTVTSVKERTQRVPSADAVLAMLEEVNGPLIRLLIASGLDYTKFVHELKFWFIDQARQEILRESQKETDSAISVLSGVHRKDIKAWRDGRLDQKSIEEIPLTSKVFTKWISESGYKDRKRQPKALPRVGEAPSFESLARSVTQDVHPFTILGELLRLGLVSVEIIDGIEYVIPQQGNFTPPPGSRELMELMKGNLADHVKVAVNNVLGDKNPALEQSVFAEGITEESAQKLSQLSRELWVTARDRMVHEATMLYENDKEKSNANQRIRFGFYCWNQDVES
jgi:Family of unknown function (DUF6502)